MHSFDDLVIAIKQNNHPLMASYLEANPALLAEKDEKENNVAHFAAQYGDITTIKTVYQALQKNTLTEHFFLTNNQGNSPLHLAAQYNQIDVIKIMIQLLGEKIGGSAKLINNDDHIPLHLVKHNPHIDQQKQITDLLEIPLLHQSYKPLSELIRSEEILSRYKRIKEDKELAFNLKLGCRVLNHTRLIIKESGTHPEINPLSSTQKENIRSRITDMRIKIESKELTQHTEEIKQKNLNLNFEHINKHKIGNCREYAYCSLKILSVLEPTIRGEMYNITNGDHVFLVIGRDPKTKINDYTTWNANTVICDAWSGQIYLASEIPIYLKDHYKHNDKNISAPVNFHIQQPSLYFSVEPEQKSHLTFFEKLNNATNLLLAPIKPPTKKQL